MTPPLLDLPAEIRLRMYAYTFDTTEILPSKPQLSIGRKDSTHISPPLIPPICLVNHQFHREALPLYIQHHLITPTRVDLLLRFAQWLEESTEQGLKNIRSLCLGSFPLTVEDAQQVMQIITQCTKLNYQSLHLDCHNLVHPYKVQELVDSFHLERIIALPHLKEFHITTEMPPRPPLPDELAGLLGTVQMQRINDSSGMARVDKARVGTRRVYTFTAGVGDFVSEVREWFRKRWAEEQRDVIVLSDEMLVRKR